jgi:hypothetical protein
MKKPKGHTPQIPPAENEGHGNQGVTPAPIVTSQSEGHDATGTQNEVHNKRKIREKLRENWKFVRKGFAKISNGTWTAIFTFFLVVFTGLLVCVSLKIDDTTRLTQRAFVSLKTFQFLVPRIDATVDINKVASHRFMGIWENSGTTPTKKAVAYASYQAMTDPIPDGFAYPDIGNKKMTPMVVGARETVYVGPLDIPIVDIQAKKHLYFWGWMEYYDIFNGSPLRLTEFCYEATFVGNTEQLTDPRTPGVFAYFWATCEAHNCYDEACADYKEHKHLK